MKQVVMDAELRARLHGGAAKVTLTDADGNKIGHYLPDDLYQIILKSLMPEEDDARAAGLAEYQQGSGLTTDEVLASLRESRRRWSGEP